MHHRAFLGSLLLIFLRGAPPATAFSPSPPSSVLSATSRTAPSARRRQGCYPCQWTSPSYSWRPLSENVSLESSSVESENTGSADRGGENGDGAPARRLAPSSVPAAGSAPAAARAAVVLPSAASACFAAASGALASALTSPTRSSWSGLMALTAVSSLAVVPLAQVRYLYSISVGYGLSVGAMGVALRRAFRPIPESLGDTLAGCTVFYGLRLASFLWLRDRSGYRPSSSSARKEPSRWSRVPFSLSLALFYACLTSPVLFVLRNPPARLPLSPSSAALSSAVATVAMRNWRWYAAWTGTIVAWIGAVLESVADAHKLAIKNAQQQTAPAPPDDDATTPIVPEPPPGGFTGPTGGAYRITRHPNYTGEVLHWVGTYVAGTACLVGRSGCWGWWEAAAWLASTSGLYGIVSIMRSATARLEERQQLKYGGDPAYESWKDQVKAPLIPFVNS